MSGNKLYNPDQVAIDTRWIQPWSEAFRAQRDVGLRVPINFHTVPAVTLSQACFSRNQYEHNAFQKCFSNLLGVGFRRFSVDVYWDSLRRVWSLCPVELPPLNTGTDEVPVSLGSTVVPSIVSSLAIVPDVSAVVPGQGLRHRQDSTRLGTSLASASAPTSVSSGTSATSISATPSSTPEIVEYPTTNGPPILQIGRYNCTSSMTLDLLTGILDNFLETTATTTGAAITLLVFDVHAAASLQNPNDPAPDLAQTQLPVAGQLLSDVLKGNLSENTYTTAMLRAQRANLNTSWYDVAWPNRPLSNYYRDSADASGNLFTQDGWPTETFMEFQKLLRLVLSYGSIDSQMELYNIGPDLDFMFPPGTLTDEVQTTSSTDGTVSSGCLFDQAQTSITTQTNSSWAISSTPQLNTDARPDLMTPIFAVTNLTSCGLTPRLNQSLASATADQDPLPYAAYVHSTLWTWAPGEPLNATTENNWINRCVTMTTSPYPGRWRVADCTDRHHVACQDPSQPYNWLISSSTSAYQDARSACRAPHEFSIPHTALENAHLLAALEDHRRGKSPSNSNSDYNVFIDLNSIDLPDCWVVGINASCPYKSTVDTNRTRIVVVPTVAAVIIFLLAALTFFVKCAANRREDKRGRKRRLVGGWEYEGVPS